MIGGAFLVLLQALAAPAAPVTPTSPPVAASRAADTTPLGKAVVTCDADVDGRLTDCVVDSATSPDIAQASLKTVRQFRLKRPALRDGVPVRSRVTLPLAWQATDTPGPAPTSTAPDPGPLPPRN